MSEPSLMNYLVQILQERDLPTGWVEANELLKMHLSRFSRNAKHDIIEQPVIGPVRAALVSMLILLTIILSLNFSEAAVITRPSGEIVGSTIPTWWGYVAVFGLCILILLIGFETETRKATSSFWYRRIRAHWLKLNPRWHSAFGFIKRAAGSFLKVLSIVFSSIDFMLVRIVAPITGLAWRSRRKRQFHTFVFAIIVLVTGLVSSPSTGIWVVLFGLIGFFAIIRRWSWIEADRDAFMIQRSSQTIGQMMCP